jgi:hypothetical protein
VPSGTLDATGLGEGLFRVAASSEAEGGRSPYWARRRVPLWRSCPE